MRIEFHGGAREVGRSCIEIESSEGKRYLLDIGIKFKEDGFVLPENVMEIPKIDGVFLSHAHLDHTGSLPLFEHKDLKGPIFCTRHTFEITRILLKDSYKIARIKNMHPAYDTLDLKEVKKDTLLVEFDKWYRHKDIRFMFLNAAHIPGSAMILLEVDGKRVLYTGDFNIRKSLLMKPLEMKGELVAKPIDVLITEATYGDKTLPDRIALEKDLIDTIRTTLKNKGSVLIPVFSVGRAQEILILLSKYKFPARIYLDGMCNKITSSILQNPSKYLDNQEALGRMFFNEIESFKSPKRRKEALKKQGIFITTSGMLQGGPVLEYIKELWHDSRNSILLTGFQCKRTNGDHLLNEGFVYLDGWKTFVKCKVKKYDFSGHSDIEGIKTFVKKLNPKNIFFQHGDEEAVENLANWASKNLKCKVYSPNVGDSYNL